MKSVIKKQCNETVLLDNVSSSKIYVVKSEISGSLYKLHTIEGCWLFCDVKNSNCGHSGVHRSMYQAIDADAAKLDGDVYEFDTLSEFLDWVRSNT